MLFLKIREVGCYEAGLCSAILDAIYCWALFFRFRQTRRLLAVMSVPTVYVVVYLMAAESRRSINCLC
jgi:hypothetical protein